MPGGTSGADCEDQGWEQVRLGSRVQEEIFAWQLAGSHTRHGSLCRSTGSKLADAITDSNDTYITNAAEQHALAIRCERRHSQLLMSPCLAARTPSRTPPCCADISRPQPSPNTHALAGSKTRILTSWETL